MQYRQLGKTPLNVSLIGYGAWALGQKGWPHVDEQEAEKTLELCIKSGINLYDTAPIYGFGRSEEILGRVLAPVRKKVVIATKCGLRWNDNGHVRHDLSRDGVHRDLEGSLKRLQTDYIDLYQIHWPDRNTPIDDTLATLMQLRSQGIIRHIGVSNFSMELLRSAAGCADIISVQECYNLLQRSPETEILPYCRYHGTGFLCYSPLAQGLLCGSFDESFHPGKRDIRRRNPLFADRSTFERAIAFVRTLPEPPARAALSFLVKQPGVSSILVSITRRRHLQENLLAVQECIEDHTTAATTALTASCT